MKTTDIHHCELVLTLLYSHSSVERSFSIRKELLENLSNTLLIEHCMVYDHLKACIVEVHHVRLSQGLIVERFERL